MCRPVTSVARTVLISCSHNRTVFEGIHGQQSPCDVGISSTGEPFLERGLTGDNISTAPKRGEFDGEPNEPPFMPAHL